jgi:ribosome-associated protein
LSKPEQLLALLVDALDSKKGVDIQTLDVRESCSYADYLVFASGRSATQVKALANHAIETARLEGVRPVGIEGQTTGEWILVDFGDVVVHAMQPTTRRFYQVERLWDASVVSPSAMQAQA